MYYLVDWVCPLRMNNIYIFLSSNNQKIIIILKFGFNKIKLVYQLKQYKTVVECKSIFPVLHLFLFT